MLFFPRIGCFKENVPDNGLECRDHFSRELKFWISEKLIKFLKKNSIWIYLNYLLKKKDDTDVNKRKDATNSF